MAHRSQRTSVSSTGDSSQARLEAHCKATGLTLPVYHDVIDTRCGQTAWTSKVIIGGKSISAGSWYGSDSHIEHARSDAAEQALRMLGLVEGRRSYVAT